MILLALIPIVAVLILLMASLVFTTMRANRLAELETEREHFVQRVIQKDAALQEAIVAALVEGKPFGETVDDFIRQRAALLPGGSLDQPAAWEVDALDEVARARFTKAAADVTRKLGTATLIVCLLVIAIGLVSVLVVYHSLPTAGSQPLEPNLPTFPALPALPSSAPTTPPLSAPAPPSNVDVPPIQTEDSEQKQGPVI